MQEMSGKYILEYLSAERHWEYLDSFESREGAQSVLDSNTLKYWAVDNGISMEKFRIIYGDVEWLD